jgi:AraC-like DNA-binding protein
MLSRANQAHSSANSHSVRFDRGRSMVCGFERRGAGDHYSWDGLRRPDAGKYPFVILQFTLAGLGSYRSTGRTWTQEPGTMFCAVVPSDHQYRLPEESSSWTFFWLLTSHEQFVQRAIAREKQAGPVLSPGVESPLFADALRLAEGVWRDRFRDEWDWEQQLLSLMCELDRVATNSLYPAGPRDRLMSRVRQIVESRFDSPPSVEQIAEQLNLSRTAFSHHFKLVTGQSPAQFVTDLRTREVRRRLTQTDEPLKAIARATGYADANHLGKAFRRVHGMSPGEFRAQLR